MKNHSLIRRISLVIMGLSTLGTVYYLQFNPQYPVFKNVQIESEAPYNRSVLFDHINEISGMQYKSYNMKLHDFLSTYEFESWPNLTATESYPSLIPEGLRITYPTPTYLPGTNISLPLLILYQTGQLGNGMGEYATLYALGKLYNVSIALTTDMTLSFNKTFPHLTTKLSFTNFFGKHNCTNLSNEMLYDYTALEIAAAGYFGPKCFNVYSYPFEIKLFNFFREEIIKEFTFSDDIQREVLDYYSIIRRNLSQQEAFRDIVDPVFIGVHARRTDYFGHMKTFGGKLPGKSFYKRALEYYRQKFSTPVFVVSSDSMWFIKGALKGESGVFFTPGESAVVDMAMLSSCNHSIFSLGSFGFWSSYLAGGEVVYAAVNTSKPYRFSTPFYEDARLSNFTPLNGDID